MQEQARAQASARSSNLNNNDFPERFSTAASALASESLAAASEKSQNSLKTSEAVTIYPSRPPPGVHGPSHQQGQAKRQQRLQRQKEIDTFYRRDTSESLPEDHSTATTAIEVVTSSMQPQNHDLKNRASHPATSENQKTSNLRPPRPVLQRQQRQSSEETSEGGRSANVHFKEDPEYFEDKNSDSAGVRVGSHQRKSNSHYKSAQQGQVSPYHEYHQDTSVKNRDFGSYGQSSNYTHQQHQNNSSFELIEDSTDYSTVIPAEALLGISPTSNEAAVLRLPAGVGQESESSTDWAKTLKQHVAQRRALPTTIESFDEEALDEKNELLNPQCNSGTGVGVGGGGLLSGTTGTSSSLHSYRIEANSFRRKPAHQHTPQTSNLQENSLQNRSSNPRWKYSSEGQPLSPAEAKGTTDISSILPSPAASGTPGSNQSSGRLLPSVPKRFVVPRVSAKDFQNQQQKVSFPFEDENNAVTHLGGLNSDNNGNSDDHLYSEPADLIDEIGPAPDNSNKTRNSANMVMDNNIDDSVYASFLDQEIIADTYSSLQRGTSRVLQTGSGAANYYPESVSGQQAATSDFIYGTYRPHNHHRTKNRGKHRIEPSTQASEFDKSCYSNFATSFEDEFPDLYNSVSRKPGNGAETDFHDINSTSTENRVQISQDCLLPLSQQQSSAYQRDTAISLANNVIKSQSSSKSETAPYQQVPTYLNTTSDRFSTSNTTDADYSVNQQSSDMNGYNTGTDTDTSHQFHLSQTTANGLTDIPNVTYNHDRVPHDYKQNQDYLDNGFNVKGSGNGTVLGSGTGRTNSMHAGGHLGQQQSNGDLFNYGHSSDVTENLLNSSSNQVEDHYHNRSTIQKSVGWANKDTLIPEESVRYQSNHVSNQDPATNYDPTHNVLTENGFGVMGPGSGTVQSQNLERNQIQDGYMHMIPNSAAGIAEDVYLEQQAQAQVEQQKQSNEYLMMGQQYYNYEAAGKKFEMDVPKTVTKVPEKSGHQDQLFSSEPFFDHNMGQLTVGNQIQLTPSWEEQRHMTEDHLNFRTLSVSMDRLDLEMNPPVDRLNLIYLTLILHGIGTLMPWNMFITAKELKRGDWVHMLTEYFVEYKLGKGYTDVKDMPYATYFQQNVGFAAQIPNLVFNWINIFLNLGGNLTSRIVWTLLIEVLVFVVTIILAMVDSSEWPGVFFYLTIGCVILLNMASGMYQSTIYGLAAKLPFKYSGAVVLGSNLSGTIVAVISIISLAMGPNPRTAAIYYFITALFILLACFDTYFALPLNRFFRYHDHMFNKALHEKKRRSAVHVMPYALIFKQCFPQCFNVFFTYFVTLTIFPAVLADVKMAHDDFPISQMYYTPITCFLTFNICAVLGNLIPSILRFPSPRWLVIPVLLRALFLPFFLLCNYRPFGVERLWPALMHWDYAYWTASGLFGLTGGYFSSLAMMYCPRMVEPEYASVAGMFGAASIVTGIFSGIGFSYLMPLIVSHQLLAFDAPEWWPSYSN